MNNIIVKKDIEDLGLEAGDLLFYRPKENLYERVKQDSVKQEGLEYTLKESLKYSIDYLQEYLDDKSMSEYEDVLQTAEKDSYESSTESLSKAAIKVAPKWVDYEEWRALRNYRILQERQLIPSFLWGNFNLINLV